MSREADVIIAKELGWKEIHEAPPQVKWDGPNVMVGWKPGTILPSPYMPDDALLVFIDEHRREIPAYTTDDKAAWDGITKLALRGIRAEIRTSNSGKEPAVWLRLYWKERVSKCSCCDTSLANNIAKNDIGGNESCGVCGTSVPDAQIVELSGGSMSKYASPGRNLLAQAFKNAMVEERDGQLCFRLAQKMFDMGGENTKFADYITINYIKQILYPDMEIF